MTLRGLRDTEHFLLKGDERMSESVSETHTCTGTHIRTYTHKRTHTHTNTHTRYLEMSEGLSEPVEGGFAEESQVQIGTVRQEISIFHAGQQQHPKRDNNIIVQPSEKTLSVRKLMAPVALSSQILSKM